MAYFDQLLSQAKENDKKKSDENFSQLLSEARKNDTQAASPAAPALKSNGYEPMADLNRTTNGSGAYSTSSALRQAARELTATLPENQAARTTRTYRDGTTRERNNRGALLREAIDKSEFAQDNTLANMASVLWNDAKSVAANIGGTMLDLGNRLDYSASEEKRRIENAQRSLETYTARRDAATTPEERARWQKLLDAATRQISSNKALSETKGKSTAQGAKELYDASDVLYQNALRAQAEAEEGKSDVGRLAVRGGLLLGNIGTQVAADLILPGIGTALRVADVAGRTARDYRQQAGEDYDPVIAGVRGLAGGVGVAAGSALSRAIGKAGSAVLQSQGMSGEIIPRIGMGSASGLGYALGEIPITEIAAALTDPNYTPDEQAINKRIGSAVAFGALSQFLAGITQKFRADEYTVTDPQRQMKWFTEDMTPDDAAKLRRLLARQYHPDAGGDAAIMQEINDEYSYFLQNFANRANAAYNSASNAAAAGDAAAYEAASAEYREAVGFLREAVADGAITGEAAEAVGVLSTIADTGIPSAAEETLTPAAQPVPLRENESANRALELFAKTLGKNGKSLLPKFFTGGDPAEYIKGMTAIYNAGMAGEALENVNTPASEALNENQKRAAYLAGQGDAKLETKSLQGETVSSTIEKATQTNWENIINDGRVSGMNKGEMQAVKSIFEKPQQKQQQKASTAETGTAFSSTLYHGAGKAASEIYNGLQYPVAGKGAYWAFTEKQAKEYGEDVSESTVTLQNPIVIRDDAEWRKLTNSAGWKYPNTFGLPNDERMKASDDLREYILSQGHDGLIIAYDEHHDGDINTSTGGSVRTLDNVFGHDQVVAYNKKPTRVTNGEKRDGQAASPQQQIADDVRRSIEKGISFNSARLFEIANKAYGGTMAEGKYTVKDAYDGMELAVNQYLMNDRSIRESANGNALAAQNTLKQLQELLTRLPTQTKRSAEQESFQQFSTPPNIAYLAAWTANIGKGDVVLEPSAGIGGLALWPKAWGATVYGNELSERRLAFLNQLGLDGTFNLNAEQINNLLPDEIKPTTILMNPPFSSTAGRTATNKTANAKRHIEQALDRLEDNGRLVAILGNGMSDDAKAFRKWWDDLREEYSIRANIRIDGENYKKYGTTFDVQLVVIDKTGPQMGKTITGEYKDLAEIPNLLEVIRNDRTAVEANVRPVSRGDAGRVQPSEPRDGGLSSRPAGTPADGMGRTHGGGASNVQNGDGGRRTGVSRSSGGNQQPVGDAENVRAVADVREQSDASVPRQGGMDGAAESVTLEKPTGKKTSETTSDVAENVDSVYATYAPSKVHIKGAKTHPAKLVESAAMAAVEPPDPTYTPKLPQKIITSGALSDAQLENIVYAGQAHEQLLPDGRRKGYFIGDGTGVGKGRQIAGIILDNFNHGRRKAVWISKNKDLFTDAVRDWEGIGQDKSLIFSQGKYKAGQDIKQKEGILFTAYGTLSSEWGKAKGLTTGRRFEDIVRWLGEDFDGVIAFDESHMMKSGIDSGKGFGKKAASNIGKAGIELQKRLPKARVIYVSATGATEVSNYAYLQRLGLWGEGTAFENVQDFIGKVTEGGLAAMELVARDMKSLGLYMARSISYEDVEYDRLETPFEDFQTDIYNTMAGAWQTVIQNIDKAVQATGGGRLQKQAAMNQFYGTAQKFFNQIITSMKVPKLIEAVRKDLAEGRSVIIQLTNTNEAQLNRSLSKLEAENGDLDDLDMTPIDTLIGYIENSFPVIEMETYDDENGKEQIRPVVGPDGQLLISKKALKMREELIASIKAMKVPDGALEMLFDAFGTENVAECTGRTRRVVPGKDKNGNTVRVVETRGENASDVDTKAFQDGKKRILIFSEAGGTGKSYHADLRAKNQERRIHYLLQPGWKADAAVQGLGRAHRSNEASAPIIRLVASNVPGEKRFLSTIARRLDQLGALTKGQREAGGGVFSASDNLEGSLAADALQQYYKVMPADALKRLGLYEKLYDEYGSYKGNSTIEREVSKFLNRLLMLPINEQETVFDGYMEYLERATDTAAANGTLDRGLENVRAEKVDVVDEKVIRKDETGAETKYLQLKVYNKPRLVPFDSIEDRRKRFQGLYRMQDGSVRAVYEMATKTSERGRVERKFRLDSPNFDVYSTYTEATLNEKCTKIPKREWRSAWAEETKKVPKLTDTTQHMLTGTMLPIWDKLPADSKRVMRIVTSDGTQYLGMIIKPTYIDETLRQFKTQRTVETFTGEQVSKKVAEENMTAVFRDDRLRLKRSRVSGEWRIELVTGQPYKYKSRFPGIITEMINYNYRYFIPTGEKGYAIIDEIQRTNPVVELQPAHGEVDAMRVKQDSYPDQWTADRVVDTGKKPKPLSEIIERIRHDLGVNITTGHVRGAGKRGQYDRRTNGVRSKIANDLPTISHEIGHHFDNIYGLRDHLSPEIVTELHDGLSDEMRAEYPEKKWTTEGIAEYFRKYLQNRETAAIDYPAFTAYVKRLMTGKESALLDQIADEINAYFSLDADTATSSIRMREEGRPDARTTSEKIRTKYDALYQQWVDSNHGIKLYARETGDEKSYKLATNAAYADAMAGAIITGDLTDANGQYVGPGLGAVLHGINLKDKNEYRLFGEYLTVKHGPERLAEGMRIFADDRKNSTAWMNRRQKELEEQYPEFAAASDRLYQFIGDLYKTWGVDTGLIGANTLTEWRERWSYYVPLNRAVSIESRGIGARRGFANQNSTVKRAHGSGLDIVHPVDNIINNLVLLVNAGVRNNVMRSITDAAEKYGADASLLEKVPVPLKKTFFDATGLKHDLAEVFTDSNMTEEDRLFALDTIGNIQNVLEQYGKGKAHGDVITVMKNGNQQFWKINDPLLLSSLTNLSPGKRGGVIDAYGAITRFMTSAITGNNIVWGIFSNFPRDLQTLLNYSETRNPLKLLGGIGSAYVNKFKGDGADPLYKEYLAMGGGQTSVYTADRDLAKKARAKLTGDKMQWLNPLEWLAFVSDTIESGPRYATYKICRQKGMTPQEAIYAAHDITVNFRRAGAASRETNKIIPFFNAGVQGLDKFARWVSADDAPESHKKQTARKRFLAYLAAMCSLGALAYAVNNYDEEAKKNYQQLSNYTKNSYWLIPLGGGKYFAIPKARELSVPASLMETLAERFAGGNKHAFDEFWSYAASNYFPSIVSDVVAMPETGVKEAGYSAMSSLGIAGVAGSILANRDFLGRPIVSASMQYYEPKDQYNRRTSKLAKSIGGAFNVSPQEVDYFFQQTLGGYWKAQKALFPVGGENTDFTLGVHNSYIKDNQYSTDLMNWLYDKAAASAAAKKSDPGNMEKAITAAMDDRMTTFYSRYYKLAKDNPETAAERGTRQIVLDMILEYQKAFDNSFISETQRMIYEVCEREGATDYLPSTMQSSVKDGKKAEHLLSDIQYVEYQTDYLRQYYEYVETSLPNAKNDREQVAILNAAKELAKDKATDRVLKRIGAPTGDTVAKYGTVDDTNVILFKAALDLANDDGSLKQQEVIDAIDALDLTRKQSSTLFHTRYDSDKNNPYK